MSQLNNDNLQLAIKNKVKSDENNIFKKILFWIVHNLKFLFIPGYYLEDLDERKVQYESKYGKKRNIHRFKSPLFIIGLCIIIILITIAVFQDWISFYTFEEATNYTGLNVNIEKYAPPSPEHPLGQTFVGFDVLTRLIFGARPVLIFSLASTFFAGLFGIFIGAISAYYGGWVDTIVMRAIEIILSFPGVVFAIIFLTIWGRDFLILILIYSIIGMPYFARLIRTVVLREKELPYIAAGKVAGAKNFRIIFRHILPNCSHPLIVAASFNIGRNILSLAVLGFLRFQGIDWIEWGLDISIAINYLTAAPWATLYPSLMILLSVLSFLLLGDSLSDVDSHRLEKL